MCGITLTQLWGWKTEWIGAGRHGDSASYWHWFRRRHSPLHAFPGNLQPGRRPSCQNWRREVNAFHALLLDFCSCSCSYSFFCSCSAATRPLLLAHATDAALLLKLARHVHHLCYCTEHTLLLPATWCGFEIKIWIHAHSSRRLLPPTHAYCSISQFLGFSWTPLATEGKDLDKYPSCLFRGNVLKSIWNIVQSIQCAQESAMVFIRAIITSTLNVPVNECAMCLCVFSVLKICNLQ